MIINFPITTTVDDKDVQLISPIIINDELYLQGNALGSDGKTLHTFTDTDFNITTQQCNEIIQEKLFPFNVTGHIFLTNNSTLNGYAPQSLGKLKGSVFSEIKYYDTSTSYATTFSFNNKPFTDNFAKIALNAGTGSYPGYGTIVSMGSPTYALMTPYISFEAYPPSGPIDHVTYGFLVVIPIFPTSIIENGKFKINKEFEPPQILIRNFNSYYVESGTYSAVRNNNDVRMLGSQYSDFRYNKTWNTYLNNMDLPQPPSSSNPYDPGGTSGAGGGNGTFDRTSDPVPFTDLPTLTAARAGMISLFNPSLAELQSLSARLWSKDFLDAFVNYFTDPSEIIISLGIVPVTPPISGRSDLQAGLISTGIEMNTVSSQFMSFNLGSMDVLPFYDAALDYAPFTKISVFLPYIGVRQLNTDEVMNNKVEIQYNIDLFSGACVAEIKVGESVLYSFNGNILSSVPVSARSFDSLISAVINGATAIGGAIATGGATAGLSISTTVNAVQASKPEILRSGNASANIGLLAGQKAYLIFEIPNQSMPENNQTFVGFPSNITAKLGDLTGFTQVDTIHLENIPATNNEITEIENLLRQGVIL